MGEVEWEKEENVTASGTLPRKDKNEELKC